MSISVPAIGAALPTPSLGGTIGKPQTAADKAKAAQDASAAQQASDLAEIRKKGLYAWAQEKKWEKLKEKIREEVLKEHGLTEQSISSMDPQARAGVENSVEQEVAERVKAAMETSLKSQAKDGDGQKKPATAMIINIQV